MQTRIATVLLALLATACASSSSASGTDVDALGIRNLAVSKDRKLLTAGQLTEDQLAALPAAGFDTVVCLRDPGEPTTGWEEEFATEHGIHFVRIPIDGGAGMTRANAEALATAIESAGHGTAVYCGSSNRVGGLIALKAHLIDGLPIDDAMALGKQHGMTRIETATRTAMDGGN